MLLLLVAAFITSHINYVDLTAVTRHFSYSIFGGGFIMRIVSMAGGRAIRLLFMLVLAWQLSGCVAGQRIDLNHETVEAQAPSVGTSVAVSVADERDFVVSGKESPDYIGQYRAGFGNPWNVTTGSRQSLADIVATDINEELESLGFTATDMNADGSLVVAIQDWNFDTYTNGRLWYDVKVQVISSTGAQLAESKVRDMQNIKGSLMTGAKYAMEEAVPRYYDELIDKIIRSNEVIRGALDSL